MRELVQHLPGERCRAAQVDVEGEGAAAAVEVLVELAARRVDARGRAQDARAERARQPLEVQLGIGVEEDAGEPAVGRGDEQRADRGVDDVEADVEEPLGRCGLRGSAGRDQARRSWILPVRSRRTPDEAAWRAASGVESSATAMSS